MPKWTKVLLLLTIPGVLVTALLAGAVWGILLVEEQVGGQLARHPVVVEHLGAVESIDLEWLKSMGHPDADLFFYRVVGARGRGEAAVKSETVSGEEERITEARLTLETGETISLVP